MAERPVPLALPVFGIVQRELGDSAEIAGEPCAGCGNGVGGSARLPQIAALDKPEEERLILDDRASCRDAELVAGVPGLVWVSLLKKSRASREATRLNSHSEPWNALVPDFVVAFTTAPPTRPNSAL